MDTWIVVAHRSGARLIDEHDDKLRVFETIDFPEGRAQSGSPSEPGRRGPPSRPSSEPRDSQRSHAAEVFASQLADKLQQGRNRGRFDELFLIAAPRFLGALRHALDATTASMVRGTLDKDYCGLSDHELLKRLEKL
jgi:protein required for attachment to host cells